ncbi:MAG: ATP-binding cassette domain-containing protein [Litoreibacter sp.]|uniref:iron ABC transporter ATP-binding protein n=1 Tax=Litoreibacter sp. TaxID=1969459 RepID=UPI00329926FE
MIKVSNVSYDIGGTQILSDISLDIQKGAITALIGPNGAGKSTLLSLIARLMPLQTGSITVDDLEVGSCASDILAQTLAILPQSSDAAPRLTVRDLVGFGRYPYHKGRAGPEDLEIIAQALDRFELNDLANRQLDTLSGGQRQRAQVAMIHAQSTEYVLLDEPLNNLDIAASRALMQLLRRLGRTVVIVLHDINYASSYADQIVAMKGGKIHSIGTPLDVVRSELLEDVFGTGGLVHDVGGRPLVQV